MKVKICGLTTQAAVDAAVSYGADFIGFVFAESRRKIAPEQVAELTKQLPSRVKKVGVFVSPTKDELLAAIEAAGLDMVQIHGALPDTSSLPVPVIRAASVKDGMLPASLQEEKYDYLLLDAPPKHYHGGNGEAFDWTQVDLAQLQHQKVIIAGGLNADNVGEARGYFHPYGVDVSSSVETDGKKDIDKIHGFLQAAKLHNKKRRTNKCIKNNCITNQTHKDFTEISADNSFLKL